LACILDGCVPETSHIGHLASSTSYKILVFNKYHLGSKIKFYAALSNADTLKSFSANVVTLYEMVCLRTALV
jgi:hypothetical protein